MNENKSSVVSEVINKVAFCAAFGFWTSLGWRIGNKIWDNIKRLKPANHKELEIEQEEETTEE